MKESDASEDAAPLEQVLQAASQLTEEGLWQEAFDLLTAAEADHADDATLLCMLGVVSSEVDARGLAYDYFRRCVAAQPEDPHVLVTLGTGLARFDDPEAETVLRLAAVTAPHLASTHLHYGTYLAREGLLKEAIEELQTARSLEADDATILRELGVAFLLSGERDQGVDLLEQASAVAPDDAQVRLLYGLALVSNQQLAEAAEEIFRAARELVEDGEAQILTALACATQGWLDEAWNALARAEAAQFPPDPDLLRETEAALEDDEEAAEALLLQEVAPPMLRERLLERP